jgi:hypothetical protein
VLAAQEGIPHSAIMYLGKNDAYCNVLLRLLLSRERGVTVQTWLVLRRYLGLNPGQDAGYADRFSCSALVITGKFSVSASD